MGNKEILENRVEVIDEGVLSYTESNFCVGFCTPIFCNPIKEGL